MLKILIDSSGWSTVELIIIFPFIFLILTAIIQFGWLMNAKLSLTYATRAGARVYSTTAECDPATIAVVKQNFISDDVVVRCYLDGDMVVVETNYVIPITLPLVDVNVLPLPHTISSKSVMLLEKN